MLNRHTPGTSAWLSDCYAAPFYPFTLPLIVPVRCPWLAAEVGMQSSALAAVLAKVHFAADPTVVVPCVLSACTHTTIGSLLAGYWSLKLKDEEP